MCPENRGKAKDSLWTLKAGKKNYFPAVRPFQIFPQLITQADIRLKALKKKPTVELISSVIANTTAVPRIIDAASLHAGNMQAQRMLRWEYADDIESVDRIKAFASAFICFSASPEQAAIEFFQAIKSSLLRVCNEKLISTLAGILIGKKFQLCFDFKEPTNIAFSIYADRIRQVVLECLQSEDFAQRKENDGTCALTGQPSTLLQECYPDWSAFPVVNKGLPPFSKFAEAKCNFRYGRAESQSFPIDSGIENKLVGSLKTIIVEKFQGTAWRTIRNGGQEQKGKTKKETRDVLIAYPSCPTEDLAVVDLFARPEVPDDNADGVRATKDFAEAAEPVCKAFANAVAGEAIAPYLILLLIRQISPGQIQLAYSATPSLTEFVGAVEAWQRSGNNLPKRLQVLLPSKSGSSGYRAFKPALLFPEDIGRLLSHQWIRGGTGSRRVAGPSVGMVLDLFLRKPGVWKDVAHTLLELTLARTGVLLTYAGHVLHRDDRVSLTLWKKFVSEGTSVKERRRPDYAFAETISLIGSLLYAMNSKVENYVNESAFRVGKLLAIMDDLHKYYCIVVRGGDIPNALMGNGLLGRASESPASALGELSERSRIYIGWAKSAVIDGKMSDKTKIAINSARKLLRLAAPLCEQLHADFEFDNALQPAQKAHLFLGYLSPVLGKSEDDQVANVTVDDNAIDIAAN